MTVAEMLSRISSLELTEWMAYYKMDPFGEERADMRSAMVCTVMANAWGKKKFKIEDFMPKFDKRPMTPQQIKDFFKQLTISRGGKIVSSASNS
jgi:hypothetical protein